jgi:sugar phosphate isomerase/epimerase
MKTNRRQFLKTAGTSLGAVSLLSQFSFSAQGAKPESFLLKAPRMKLGIVTYNLAKDWDLDTIIKNCAAARFDGVELRTTHAHGVEIALTAEQRAEVKKKFQGPKVELMSLGSAFDYHTSDQSALRKTIEASKQYIQLAHDVGAPAIKVRPNGLPKDVPKEKTLAQIGKSLRELGEAGAGLGVEIRLEVHGAETSLVPNIKAIMDAADHKSVRVCWNSNASDLSGEGFDHNFDLVKDKIGQVHMRELYLEDYPFRRLLTRLNETGFTGYCLAELSNVSADPVTVMKYYRGLWLAYQGLL